MPCIYCVEDDENIRELVAYALESQQFETQTFADGESFYKVLEKKIPDLVLLDIMLPGESGIEILKKIRHKERTADLPVIMLTARTSEYDVVKGLTIGADDYVTKPFGILELISRMRLSGVNTSFVTLPWSMKCGSSMVCSYSLSKKQ